MCKVDHCSEGSIVCLIKDWKGRCVDVCGGGVVVVVVVVIVVSLFVDPYSVFLCIACSFSMILLLILFFYVRIDATRRDRL